MKSTPLENVLARLESECQKANTARAGLRDNNQEKARFELQMRVAREFLLRNEVDAACRHWMKTGLWSKPEFPDTVLHYWDRLFEAMMLAGWLHTSGFFCEKTEDQLLELFLIGSWEAIGLRRLQARLQQWPG
jgi:hypothetical protein